MILTDTPNWVTTFFTLITAIVILGLKKLFKRK